MRAMLGRTSVEDCRQVARQHVVYARHDAGQDMLVILEGGREWGERTSQRAPIGRRQSPLRSPSTNRLRSTVETVGTRRSRPEVDRPAVEGTLVVGAPGSGRLRTGGQRAVANACSGILDEDGARLST
jgi:hypothetical protein